MLTKLLTIKHWQLFLLIFAIPILVQIGALIIIISTQSMGTGVAYPVFDTMIVTIIIVSLISQAIYMMWLWAIGTKIYQKLPAHLKLDVIKFKLVFVITVVLFFILISMMALLFASIFGYTFYAWIFSSFPIIFVIEVMIMVLMVYIFNFIAKTISLIEMKTEVKLSDYFVYIILIWLFPIGVWILQPKLNKIMQGDE